MEGRGVEGTQALMFHEFLQYSWPRCGARGSLGAVNYPFLCQGHVVVFKVARTAWRGKSWRQGWRGRWRSGKRFTGKV